MPLIKILSILAVFFVVDIHRPTNVHAIGMAKVTVKVLDEEEKPIKDADVRVCFHGGCTKAESTKGKTDIEGVFTASGASYDGVIGGGVEKEGYYYSGYHNDFHRNVLGMWQPWNKEIKVVLRPKVNPVPMYVRNRFIEIPVANKKIGFDLMKFDWVSPYGQGTHPDFIFHLDRKFTNMNDYETTITITFSNKYDGIQHASIARGGDFDVGSEFRLPRYAPEFGYQSKFVKRKSRNDPDFFAIKEDTSYFFYRVRSEADEKGNFKRAMYGKIIKEIDADPTHSKTALIRFTYYLNPDYTRNLEYDPVANLFGPLPKGETSLELP